jgi:tRNA-Thr(GGU) m(6)t(6)A37 methyltransferase TsaA
MPTFTFDPIGYVRSPFAEKSEAPRQAVAAAGTVGRIELVAGRDYEHALDDLEGWSRIWVIFVFDRAEGFRPKVLPPRSEKRRGLFATRAPHRPNPIGISAVQLVGVEGLVLTIKDLDLLDGTPVLDIKPYVPYADAFPEATTGWLAADPVQGYEVGWAPRAAEQAAWLTERGIDVRARVDAALALGPQPNAYRRIRRADDGTLVLAVKEWRARFVDEGGRRIVVTEIASGYRPRQLHEDRSEGLDVHRAFVEAFPSRS